MSVCGWVYVCVSGCVGVFVCVGKVCVCVLVFVSVERRDIWLYVCVCGCVCVGVCKV